jgi:hypothetical protein
VTRGLPENGRWRVGSLATSLAILGALAVCCVGPVVLFALAASAGAWFLHAGAFVMVAGGAAAALITAGLVRRSRACARASPMADR